MKTNVGPLVWLVLVIVMSLILMTGSSAQDSKDPQVQALIDGLESNLANFKECTIELLATEKRFVDKDGVKKTVTLDPRHQLYCLKGKKFYFRHDGGVYLGESQENASGLYEGAYDLGQYVEFRHHEKAMNIFPDPQKAMSPPLDPILYIGSDELKRLKGLPEGSPGAVSAVKGKEALFGDACVCVETTYPGGAVVRLWIDQAHGFLPRKRETWNVDKISGELSLRWRTEMPEVKEVASGVWAPSRIASEGAIGDGDFHHERNISFDRIDISTPIPEDRFTLKRPPGYYVNDYVLNAHYQPEILSGAAVSPDDLRGDSTQEDLAASRNSKEPDPGAGLPPALAATQVADFGTPSVASRWKMFGLVLTIALGLGVVAFLSRMLQVRRMKHSVGDERVDD